MQGGTWAADSQVMLEWRRVGSYHMREGVFFIAENSPCDILLGSDFLFPEGVFAYNEPALPFVQDPKSPGIPLCRHVLTLQLT